MSGWRNGYEKKCYGNAIVLNCITLLSMVFLWNFTGWTHFWIGHHGARIGNIWIAMEIGPEAWDGIWLNCIVIEEANMSASFEWADNSLEIRILNLNFLIEMDVTYIDVEVLS